MAEIRGGVLLVGSLLWDDRPPRTEWRERWLALGDSAAVRAPIRYGRCSSSRGGTYTMVFSRLCLRPEYKGGVGIAVPFRLATAGFDDLLDAARALWEAESLGTRGRVSAPWGSVGMLANPCCEAARALSSDWAAQIRNEQSYGALSHSRSEGPPVDAASGRLRIPWPRGPEGTPCPLDFLLATATDPTLTGPGKRYPTVGEITRAWIDDGKGEVRYFVENRQRGITTFQDERIRRELQAAGFTSVQEPPPPLHSNIP